MSMSCPSPLAPASPAPGVRYTPQYQAFQPPLPAVRGGPSSPHPQRQLPPSWPPEAPAPSRFGGAKAAGAGPGAGEGGSGGAGSGSVSGSGRASGKGGPAAGKGAAIGVPGGAGPEAGAPQAGGAQGGGARGEGPSWKRLEPWQIEFLELCFAAGETEVDRERREHLAGSSR